MCYSVLERDQDRILFEIICQKHGVPNFEVVRQKSRLRLVRLDSTERCKLRFALRDVQNGLCSILTNVVLQQTAKASQISASGGTDSSKRTKGSVLKLHQRGIRLQGLRKVLSSICA